MSVQPRKQRKALFRASLHTRHKLLGTHLSKELRIKFKKRALPVRKGDKVKVMRGEHRGKIAKVTEVYPQDGSVYLDGLMVTKNDGTKKHVPFRPSNLLLMEMELEDKRRKAALERGKKQ